MKSAITWLHVLSSTHFLLVGHSVLFFGVAISNSSGPFLKVKKTYEGFHKWGTPQIGLLISLLWEDLTKMDDLRVPLFQETCYMFSPADSIDPNPRLAGSLRTQQLTGFHLSWELPSIFSKSSSIRGELMVGHRG